jgi:hypothetical protein
MKGRRAVMLPITSSRVRKGTEAQTLGSAVLPAFFIASVVLKPTLAKRCPVRGLDSPEMKGTRVCTLEMTDILDTPKKEERLRTDRILRTYPLEPGEGF